MSETIGSTSDRGTMIVGNRKRENAPTTFIISKTAVSGAAAASTDELTQTISELNALTQASGTEIAKLKTDLAAVRSIAAGIPAPIGTVIGLTMTAPQFQAEYGTFNASRAAKEPGCYDICNMWVMADGRDVTGSEYARTTGRTKIPDLRGAFLRGSQTNANGWMGGDINTYVEDSTKRPNTPFTTVVNDPLNHNGNTRGLAGAAWGANESYLYAGASTRSVTGGGDAETRPKHYVVTYYIRIN